MRISFPGFKIREVAFRISYHRLVALDRLHQVTRKEETQSKLEGGDPFIVTKPPSASRGGVAEKFIKVLFVKSRALF